MPPCPNCGTPVPPGARLCPNCGQELPDVWPPPPEGQARPEPPLDAWRVRNEVNSGVAAGCLAEFALWVICVFLMFYGPSKNIFAVFRWLPHVLQTFLADCALFGPPIVAVAVAHVIQRKTRPYYARGLGYSVLIGVALSLGLLAICGQFSA